MTACRDCRHFAKSNRCHHPQSYVELVDFATGVKGAPHARSIDFMRTGRECGPDAKLFEPKER